MQPKNPDYAAKVAAVVGKAAFIGDLGVALSRVAPGECDSVLDVSPRHLQQNGYVHAGVLATIGDHTAGAAAASLVAADEGVLTVEFKINLLSPAKGRSVECRARVLRPGRTLSVVESELYAVAEDGARKLVAKQTVTLAVVRDTMLEG